MKFPWRNIIGLLLGIALTAPAAASGQRAVAVTIDDLPFVHINRFDEAYLSQQFTRLVDALTAADIEAIGFVNEHRLYRKGQLDPTRVSLLQQWLDAGMELGNHTYAHVSLNSVGAEAFEDNILRGEAVTRPLVAEADGKLRYFRHPFLHVGKDMPTRQRVERFLQQHGYTVAPVTILSEEWVYAAAYDNALTGNKEELLPRIGQAYLEHMEQAIVHAETLSRDRFGRNIDHVLLLHANMLNAEYLPELIEIFRGRGYRFTTLDEALQDRAYATRDTYARSGGDSWLHHWLLSAGLQPRPGPGCPAFIRQLAGASGNRGY